jgi:hypothetical protein
MHFGTLGKDTRYFLFFWENELTHTMRVQTYAGFENDELRPVSNQPYNWMNLSVTLIRCAQHTCVSAYVHLELTRACSALDTLHLFGFQVCHDSNSGKVSVDFSPSQEEFDKAVDWIVGEDTEQRTHNKAHQGKYTFSKDLHVSVFETNIRIIGGLCVCETSLHQ